MNPDLTRFTPRAILILQLKQIGDVLLMTPVAELLARRFPDAAIHVLTEKKCVPVLENNPHISVIHPLDTKKLSTLPREVAFYWRLTRQNRFDMVVDLQQTPRCRWVAAFSGAPVRITHEAPWYTAWLYTHRVPVQKMYASAMKARVLEPLGIRWNGEKPRLYLTENERNAASVYLASLGYDAARHTLVTVDPTHRRETRRWPGEHYAALLDAAFEADPSLRFFMLYGPGEEEEVRAVTANCRHPEALLVPDRVISLRESAACIEAAVLHFGNCSAPRHMAVALDTPTLTVLGSTGKGWTFPSPENDHVLLGLPCQPCNKNTCPDKNRQCLYGLTPRMVLPVFLEKTARAREKGKPEAKRSAV